MAGNDLRALSDDLLLRVVLSDLIGRDVAMKRRGREYVGLCPFHAERTPSFTVNDEKGFYYCFGCGAGGDAISYLRAREGCDFAQAVARLAAICGLAADGADADRVLARARGSDRGGFEGARAARLAAARQRDLDARRRKIARAGEIWRAAGPVAGSVVETYLSAGRGIDLSSVPGWPIPTLRCAVGLPYMQARGADGFEIVGHFPAMIAYVQRDDGSFAGIHRTYLASDGAAKAPVESPKKMMGDVFGGYLRLCRAESEMASAEGIETALSVMSATGMPVWAALSEGNLDAAMPPIVRKLTICADNDTRDPDASRGRIDKARRAHAARGCAVRVALPPAGMDYNNLLQVG